MSDAPTGAPSPSLRRYRVGVAVRGAAAIGGGYLLAALVTRALATTLPLRDVDAVVSATLAGLVVYPLAIMYAFATASAARACLGLAGACAFTTIVILVARALGGHA